jgi:hypothetical protein
LSKNFLIALLDDYRPVSLAPASTAQGGYKSKYCFPFVENASTVAKSKMHTAILKEKG